VTRQAGGEVYQVLDHAAKSNGCSPPGRTGDRRPVQALRFRPEPARQGHRSLTFLAIYSRGLNKVERGAIP